MTKPGQQPTAYTVESQIADARASVGDITAEAQFCISEIGVLRREDREIALASEVLRLRAALRKIAAADDEGGASLSWHINGVFVVRIAREALAT